MIDLPEAPPVSPYGAKLFSGNFPKAVAPSKSYFSIPSRFRPSPLNVIYRPHTPTAAATIAADGIYFDFLDFDAF